MAEIVLWVLAYWFVGIVTAATAYRNGEGDFEALCDLLFWPVTIPIVGSIRLARKLSEFWT